MDRGWNLNALQHDSLCQDDLHEQDLLDEPAAHEKAIAAGQSVIGIFSAIPDFLVLQLARDRAEQRKKLAEDREMVMRYVRERNTAFAQRDYDAAVALFDSAVELNRRESDTHLFRDGGVLLRILYGNRATANLFRGNFTEALGDSSYLVSAPPEYVKGFLLQG